MKVEVHKKVESPLENCLGFYDAESKTIHMYDFETLGFLVFEHEKVHFERRNTLLNRFVDAFLLNRKRKLMVCLSAVVLFSIGRFFLGDFGVSVIAVCLFSFGVFLYSTNRYEENVVDAKARKRMMFRRV